MPRTYFRSKLLPGFLLLLVIVLFSSWSKLSNHFLFINKAGNAAYRLSVKHHQINLSGLVIKYQSTTGYMPVSDSSNNPAANIFYTAYTLNDSKRPVTFVFNGGPGSASIWLHMGAFGPVRALFKNQKGDATSQADYGDNPNSWLGFTDLVFIDPVSTGYSRAEEDVEAKQFYNYTADINIIGTFINNYLKQNHRQNSPKFLAGESYGSVRAIGLAQHLQQQYHINLNGITLISPALNYQLIKFDHGNETPYSYYLPSYAVAAQYHQRLAPELQRLTIEQLQAKTTQFAQGVYTQFLNEGDAASPALTKRVLDSLNYYTGIPLSELARFNGRITYRQFSKLLLKTGNQVAGTFDSRFTGTAPNADPSETNIRGAFTGAFNKYVTDSLQYQNNLPYHATAAVGNWNYGPGANNSYLNISETLKKVMTSNPGLKIQVAAGYYDLATPVGSTEYVIRHLALKPGLRGNISLNHYQAGHMIYISQASNAQFKTDSEKFYANTLSTKI